VREVYSQTPRIVEKENTRKSKTQENPASDESPPEAYRMNACRSSTTGRSDAMDFVCIRRINNNVVEWNDLLSLLHNIISPCLMMSICWRGLGCAKLPMNIMKIFLWEACYDKIQSAEQLVKRNWPGSASCKMCGQVESTDHILLYGAFSGAFTVGLSSGALSISMRGS